MTRAFFDGVRRVLQAPIIVIGVYVVTALAAAPLAFAVRDAIATHLGSSVTAETVARGVDWAWWEEFQSAATGIANTFVPRILGFAAVLTNLSNLIDNVPLRGTVVFAVIAYLLVWTFLTGGIIDRFARQRRVGSAGFFAACGTHFFRFCRLAVLAVAAYWILFGLVHGWLLGDLYDLATRNLAVERTTFAIRLSLYALFGLLVLPVNLVFDYAKIRSVVEDRRSMLGAVLAAVRFIRRHPADTAGLYAINAGFFLVVLTIYAIAAPAPSPLGLSLWLAFLVGQAYVVARLFAKLVFYASQIALFQHELAHAEYVAAPRPVWPDSPAAEAIGGPTT